MDYAISGRGSEGAIMWWNVQGATVTGLYLLLAFNITSPTMSLR